MKRNVLAISLIVILEILIFYWSMSIGHSENYYFQLAARFSARVSFFILVSLLAWMGFTGLKKIYATEWTRKNYVTLILMLMVNHLIHFGFLWMNYQVNDISMMEANNVVGVIGYIAITLAPLYLWNKSQLTPQLYLKIYSFLFAITFIFTFSYIDRLSKALPFPTPKVYFIISLLVIAGLLVLNALRILREGHSEKEVISRRG